MSTPAAILLGITSPLWLPPIAVGLLLILLICLAWTAVAMVLEEVSL